MPRLTPGHPRPLAKGPTTVDHGRFEFPCTGAVLALEIVPAQLDQPDYVVMDSWTSSPTAALAAFSAALLTPTHRPPPATSIVLPVNGAPLRLPVTRICRRPPRSATEAAGMSTTASPPGLSSRHWRTRALKATMQTSITCRAHSAGVPGDVVFDVAAQRFQRLLKGAVNQAAELGDAGRVEWLEGRAHCDGSGVRV